MTLALAAVLVAGGTNGCRDNGGSSGEHPDSTTSPTLCDVYATATSDVDRVTVADSNDEVSAKLDRARQVDEALADAASGSLESLARRELQSKDRYREVFLEQLRSAGGGAELLARAEAAGYLDSRSFLESLAFTDVESVHNRSRELSSELAAACDDLRPPDPVPLAAAAAPTGEILAVKLGSGEIHRFSTTGSDLGVVPLPGVGAPVRQLTLSPDGDRLAFTAGSTQQMWVLDLSNGESSPSTAHTCVDWDDDGRGLWASAGRVPNSFVARIAPDGGVDPDSRLNFNGCPYRYTESALMVPRPVVDGEPVAIYRVSKDGSSPEPLIATECDFVNPRISPDSTTILLTVGCSTERESGVYLADASGTNLRQVFPGTAAAATWSPDGEWITFGAYDAAHPGDTHQIRVFVATADGQTIGSVTPPGYSWPIWRS